MSNKNQLLNHNERLASVIQTLQGKAAGGGGASVEICIVFVPLEAGYSYVTCDAENNITSIVYPNLGGENPLTVVKGTYIHVQVPTYYEFRLGEGVTLVAHNAYGALLYISPTAPNETFIDYWGA